MAEHHQNNTLRAFVEEAYIKYGPQVKRYLHRRVGDPELRRDLAHEVWRRILGTPKVTEIREPLAYFYTVTAHVIAEHYGFRGRDRVAVDSATALHAAEHPTDIVVDEMGDEVARELALERLMASLPMTYRQILILRITEDLSYAEIGKRLGLAPKTAREYFSRAMMLAHKLRPKRF
jgi:RNA polymerase sigma-70 factor (ECF subfamily)